MVAKRPEFLVSLNIIYILICVVYLYPINVKTAKPIGPNFFCGISRDHRKGLWMIKFSKICLHQNSIFENFENPQKFFL